MPHAAPQEASSASSDIARASTSGDEGAASTSSSDSPSSSTFTISPAGATAAGVAVAAAACALAAGGHWRATASALAEEGIDAVTRRRALPTAARALGVATAACLAATALVGGAASALGFLPQLAGEAEVATPAGASEAAERARAAVRGSMRSMILGADGGGDRK